LTFFVYINHLILSVTYFLIQLFSY